MEYATEVREMPNEPWDFYAKYARTYGDWAYTRGVKAFQTAEKLFLLEHISPGSKVIDIGCGPGEHISSMLGAQCEITAVDFVQEMIDIAKTRVGNSVRFICEDIKNLAFPEDHFDYGVCYCTLPNQKNYQSVFDQISSYCRALIISVYNWESRFEVAEFYKLNGLSPEMKENERTILLEEGLRYIFIPEENVTQMFKRNGYPLSVSRYDFGNIYYGVKRK